MIKKCKFEVDVTYNSKFFAEGEIRETLRNAINDLSNLKENQFGRLKMVDCGKTNKGVSCNVNQVTDCFDSSSVDIVETLVSLSKFMDDNEPSILLSDSKVNELTSEVNTAFDK